MSGASPEAHLGHRLREILPDLAPRVEPIVRQLLATGVAIGDVEITGTTQPDSDGRRGDQRRNRVR